MIQPLKFTDTMPMGTLVNAINQNFSQIEAENRTKIIRDENGDNKILIGLAPDGTYGIFVIKPGYDVLKELNS